ncbi:MAG: hypothetical protein H0U35_04425 [Sporichthyaceae bacterium]|nr:hypothetical protein [Sporichthyaceae bacterium]
MRAIPVPTAVFAASEVWAGGDGTSRPLVERIDRAEAELADLLARRPQAASVDPFETPTPFEEMLRAF